MANKTKYTRELIKEIMEELAIGNSIRSCLSPQNKKENRPCWETFRSWLNKDDKLNKTESNSVFQMHRI